MTDNISPLERSRIMALVRSKNTTPEMIVRKRLHAAGFRFRLHVNSLPGKPDIVLPRRRTVVFVHGCLWHWHGCKRSRMPASNATYWVGKIQRNMLRDAQHLDDLRQSGWRVEVIWECDVSKGIERVVEGLMSAPH